MSWCSLKLRRRQPELSAAGHRSASSTCQSATVALVDAPVVQAENCHDTDVLDRDPGAWCMRRFRAVRLNRSIDRHLPGQGDVMSEPTAPRAARCCRQHAPGHARGGQRGRNAVAFIVFATGVAVALILKGRCPAVYQRIGRPQSRPGHTQGEASMEPRAR